MKDYYKILGIARDSSVETIKQKFKELAFEYHPDVSDNRDAGDIFIEIYEAYHILSHPEKKKNYDLLHDKYISNIRTYIPGEESLRDDITNISDQARANARQKAQVRYNDFIKDLDCFFMDGQKADGVPYSYNMHKNVGISGGIGPMGSIKSKTVSIPVPRSKKALRLHRIGSAIKALFFLLSIFTLRIDLYEGAGILTKVLSSAVVLLAGGLITHLIYFFIGLKSKFFYAGKYFLVEKYRRKGYKRGFHPMISTTPVGIISYILRLIF
jgi:hypothetical protein